MCGIAGQARSDGRPVDVGMLESMCAAQEHRGPDSRGTHVGEGVGLGIQRLRVIDLDTGDQPIYNEDRSIAVVLNGEIYNYRELRERLLKAGHKLSSKGDTEVIAHLYEDLGPDCVRELQGMFAFALWDERRRRLFIGRDRVGKKPLFYALRDGALSFASELRALLQDSEVPRDIDHVAIDSYVAYGYVPAPLSAFSAVRKLPPGSTLTYEDGRASIERYWRLRYDRGDVPTDPRELHERIRAEIRTAVESRMISDVPLGVFLSGGIDSSTVVAAMAEASSSPVRTFSIGFEEKGFSELPNARLISERFGTEHTELVIRPDVVSIIPKVARHYGEPFGDSSSVPSFYVAEMARRDVTVALNGDGGDESFGGYNRYVTVARAAGIAGRLPGPVRRALAAAGARSRPRGDPARALNRARRLAGYVGLSERDLYSDAMEFFDARARDELYTPEFAESLGGETAHAVEERWDDATATSLVNRMMEVDVGTYLPDDLLVKVDIASMAYSLEARSPLLDHRLMEFAASIPGEMKIQGTEKKVVMRDALRGWIPDRILDGPKRGFDLAMVGQWFRGELRDYVRETLLDPTALGRGYFREDALRGLVDRHMDGIEDNSLGLWSLIMLEVWHRELIDG
jgi:asparagine synthase (glutamine-hydrolysing)